MLFKRLANIDRALKRHTARIRRAGGKQERIKLQAIGDSIVARARVLGDYVRKTLSDGYAQARDREELANVERKEAAVAEYRALLDEMRTVAGKTVDTGVAEQDLELVREMLQLDGGREALRRIARELGVELGAGGLH